MKKINTQRFVRNSPVIPFLLLTISLTVYFYFQKYQLGLVRYFDIDEFAYLNFAHQYVSGSTVYKSFVYYVTPGYLFFLAPIIRSVSPEAILSVIREAAFGVFVFLSAAAAFLFWQARKSWWWIAVPLILVFLPLPSDKFLESRPDTLMTALFILGVAFQIRAFQARRYVQSLFSFLLSGFFYSASAFVLQKTLLLIPWGIIVYIVWLIWGQKHQSWKQNISTFAVFGFGLSSFFWILFLWSYSQGTLGSLWYYLVVFAKETNILSSLYPYPPELIFLPNDVYYGLDGYHVGFLLNAILWIGAVFLSGLSLFVSCILYRKKTRFYTDLLLNGFLLVSLGMYWFFPSMKHPQYLIPASVFVAIVWTDTINILWNSTKKHLIGAIGFCCIWAIALVYLFRGYGDVNSIKFRWHNRFDKEMLVFLTGHIPKNEYVLDLVGLAYLYPQPYIACCIPFGQFEQYVSRPFPSLPDSLIQTHTKYIYQGVTRRIMALSENDRQYIKNRFSEVGSGALLVRNDMLSAFQNMYIP